MKELKAEKAKLGRLYDFDDGDDEDDVLRDKIRATKDRIKELERQLSDEQQKASISKKVEKSKALILSLQDQWPQMTPQDRQIACRELIEKIVIYKDQTIDIRLKLRKYLVNQN